MLLHQKLKDIPVILGSQSPRRKELLASLLIDFEVLIKDTDESYDASLTAKEIVEQIALKKLHAINEENYRNHLLITADTIVVTDDNLILGKPKDREEAKSTLNMLSAKSHHVYTAVAYSFQGKINWFSELTTVTFEKLSDELIDFYLDNYNPYDKAGSYGIQEWFGRVAVRGMDGSYENVMGLPTARLYKELIKFF
ncbi:Maf family protein [Sphingobacterium hungaricum]|uniref:dTTP/UTP pyrophosphatase n=1 Tax=Sphingobacterium hungaricum TaxID=2082723 RepID=A0A928YRF4_9SPHI|nr:Maf family protein [Sphingobacterium hungaricum]MBE8713278.1 septum formation protein Maf [Sphingobacterium hungaricum]